MHWLLLTAISVIFRSIYGVMTKVLSNHVKKSIYTQATLLLLAGAFISLLLSPFIGGLDFNFEHVSMVAVALVVLGQGLGNIAYFEAIKDLTNSTAQVAFSSILLFNTVLSLIFLNLHLSVMNVIGLLLLMVAILSVTTGKIELNRRGVALMVLSALLFSVFQLSSAEVSKQIGAATYLIIAYMGAAIVVLVAKWRVVKRDVMTRKGGLVTMGIPFLTALPSVGNFLFAYYAYRIAPEPAKVAMLLTSQIVLTVLLSYFIFKEKDHLWRTVFAAILVVLAAILIKS